MTAQLARAGFAVTRVAGSWDGAEFDGSQDLMIVTATATAIPAAT